MSFLVFQSSRWGKEDWLLYFYCLLDVILVLLFFDSYWQCSGLGLWYVIMAFPGHTHLLFNICLIETVLLSTYNICFD